MAREVQMELSIPPDEALGRLAGAIEEVDRFPPLHLGQSGSKDFVGRVEGDSFRFHLRAHYANPLAPVCSGTVEPDAGGCRISARIGAFPVVRVGLAVWLALVGLGLSAVLVEGALGEGPLGERAGALAVLTAMAVVGLVLALLGRAMSRRLEPRLCGLLRELFVEFARHPRDLAF
ncbi:MAG: hypothetical protein ACYS1C_06375 [Planctomycetota bacterium]|jgi:hypothetical protein